LVIRIKGYNTATTPQAQKILSDIGLRQINNAVFLHTTSENLTKITLVKEYIAFGYPTKKIVNELIRKRGFLKKEDKKLPITDNVLIEELLGGDEKSESGCICIEDIIDSVWKCAQPEHTETFKNITEVLWPFQLGSLKETIEESNIKHDATGRDVRKKTTRVEKGGYVGFMAAGINEFIRPLI
jgi:large subunit ribosomal protein L7e